MSAPPNPRPALIVGRMEGLARRTPHSPVEMCPDLILAYQSDRPYAVQILIGKPQDCQYGPTHGVMVDGHSLSLPCDCDLTPWTVSREVLCNAALWQTPAGMGDFRVAPMGDGTTQLVFCGSTPEDRGESIYVDVKRKDLLGFLQKTLLVVKPGGESQHLDMDALLAALMDRTI